MTEPCDLPATEARTLMGARRLSATELAQSCISRIEAVDHAVNAVVARDFDRALDAARAADEQRGPLGALHGLPLGVKDLEDVAGLRTTYGSPLFSSHVPAADDGAVRSLRAAGAIVLGKTNTPEWGAGANTRNAVYGATGNPFDPQRSAAGSSGGSAVALATGMVALATGSDLGGSLRNPAAFNGIVGFRPSPGLVPYGKRLLGWSGLSVLGPMARTVPDLCLMLSAMVAEDAADPLSYVLQGRRVQRARDYASPAPCDPASLRVALSPDLGFAPIEQHIREVFSGKTGLFRHIFAVADDAAPDCAGADDAFEVLRALGAVASHADKVRDTPEQVGPNVHKDVSYGLRCTATDVARAMKLQTALYHRWQAFFEHYDVLLTPAVTISPRPWSELYPAEIDGTPTRTYFHWLALAYAVTLAGHPAVSLPVGLDRHGMPFGLQVVGRRGGDAHVLAAAAALERMLAGDARTARPVPDVARLRGVGPISAMPGFMGFG